MRRKWWKNVILLPFGQRQNEGSPKLSKKHPLNEEQLSIPFLELSLLDDTNWQFSPSLDTLKEGNKFSFLEFLVSRLRTKTAANVIWNEIFVKPFSVNLRKNYWQNTSSKMLLFCNAYAIRKYLQVSSKKISITSFGTGFWHFV